MLKGRGHQASRTKRSAVKTSSCSRDWLGRAADRPVQVMVGVAAYGRHAQGDQPSRHTPAVPTGSAWRQTSSISANNAEGGGHWASGMRRSAVKAHTSADWLSRVADEQHLREQCRRAEAVRHHAQGGQPLGHTPAVPTVSAWRLMRGTSASNADRQPPSGDTHEAISRQGTRQMCRLARHGCRRAAPARAMLKAAAANERHTRGDQRSTHMPPVPTGLVMLQLSSASVSDAEGQRPPGITHEAISRQGAHPLCRLARHGGRPAAPARALMIGGGHRASRTRRSADRARARCAD